MDVVGVMAAYLSVVRVCTAQSREALWYRLRCCICRCPIQVLYAVCPMQVLCTVICRCYVLLYTGVMVTSVIVTPMYSKYYILLCPSNLIYLEVLKR